jgi:hypothetical protein
MSDEQPKHGLVAPVDLKPQELDSFGDVTQAIGKAKEQADRIPEEIPDRGVLGEASDALRALRLARKDAETTRKAEKAPYLSAGTRIDSTFNELGASVNGMEKSLEARILAFEAKEREAREAERKREEKNQRERQKRENERAEKEQRQSRHVPAPPPPPPPPRGARGSVSKTTPKKVWDYEITDEAQLPDEYLTKTPNRKMIRAHVEAGVAIPGVRAWRKDQIAVSTPRS